MFNPKIPTTYAQITLGQYVKWHTAKDSIAKCAAALSIDPSDVRKLNPESVARIIAAFEKVVETELSSHIKACKLNGNEYGFIPSIDHMKLGEYVDLDELSKVVFVNNDYEKLTDMMCVCYRPIINRMGDKYTISDYTGKEIVDNRKDIEQLPMSVVSGALLFFSTFEIELLTSSLDYLTEVHQELQMDLQST